MQNRSNYSMGSKTFKPSLSSKNFSEQLKFVMKDKFGYYNKLAAVWKQVGNKTTISVYPILQKMAQLFSCVEWLGKYGGLKESYEINVPQKFIKDYRRAMYSGEIEEENELERELGIAAENLDSMTQMDLNLLTVNAQVPIILRDKAFYRYFPIESIDQPKKCQEIWGNLSEMVRRVLCFDQKSISEMSMFLRIEAEIIKSQLGDLSEWPIPIYSKEKQLLNRKKSFKETISDLSSDDLSDVEIDQNDTELIERIRKFEEEVLGIKGSSLDSIQSNSKNKTQPISPQKRSESDVIEQVCELTKQISLDLLQSNSTVPVNEKQKNPQRKNKKSKKKNRRNKWEDDRDLSPETALVLQKAFGGGKTRKGPFLSDRVEEEEINDFQDCPQNFEQGDFVAEPLAETENNLEQGDLNFLREYNAAGRDETNQNRTTNSIQFLEENVSNAPTATEQRDIEREAKKGFIDDETIKKYQDVKDIEAELGNEREDTDKPKIPNDETPRKEIDGDKENSLWEKSLRRNAKIRNMNDLEKRVKGLIDPKGVDSGNFDSKGEFLASFFKNRYVSDECNKDEETGRKGQIEQKISPGFKNWYCYCGNENEYRRYRCKKCGHFDEFSRKDKLRSGIVINYNKKNGCGSLRNLEDRARKEISFTKQSIWSSDLTLSANERVCFRMNENSALKANEVVPVHKGRRMLVGDCIHLDPENDCGWIRIRRGGKRRADVFFSLSDYESGQIVSCGMAVRFEVDISVTQPRAFAVRPLYESYIVSEEENEKKGERKKSGMKFSPQKFYRGTVLEWRGNFGFVQPDNGFDRVMVSADAIMTKTKKLQTGQSVEFSVEVADITQTGHVKAAQLIKVDPYEHFYGTIVSLSEKFGFVEPNLRWKLGQVYFNSGCCKSDFRKLENGDRVRFYLTFTPKGVAAECVEVIDSNL